MLRVDFATSADLPEVRALRAAAYGRHLDIDRCGDVQAVDAHDDPGAATVLVCRAKWSAAILGTVRLHGPATLPIEADVPPGWWPDRLQHGGRIECARLALAAGATSSGARLALWKAVYWHTMPRARWLVLGARSAALVRMYEHLGCQRLAAAPLPLRCMGGMPHHVMALDVREAARLWADRAHPLLAHMLAPDPAICTMSPGAGDEVRHQVTKQVTRATLT